MSSDSPNMQNIPARDTSEFRECFIARPGNKLVILDYSAQEPRITAYLTGDRKLKEIFLRGEDIYIGIAKELFGKEITKDDPLRSRMKSTILGVDYGMSPIGLARRENISTDEAEDILNTFLHKKFKAVGRWVERQKKKKKLVTTVSGRKIHLNHYSTQCENNALNAPHQGTAADMMKVVLGETYHNWDFDFPYACVETTHDELAFDVPEDNAEEVGEWAKKIMERVGEQMCPGVSFKADYKICDSWADKE